MNYTSEKDPLCYEGTNVLKNKMNLINQDQLDEFETAMVTTRIQDGVVDEKLTYDYYKSLHYHLFQDVYEWAGKIRNIRIGKAGNWFCYPEYIDTEMKRLFSEIEKKEFLENLALSFSEKAAHVIAEINAIHPFREGNGRTQLVFLRQLAKNADLPFHSHELPEKEFMNAMIESFSRSEKPLANIISRVTKIL